MRTYLPTIVVTLLLFTGVFWSFGSAKSRPGTIVLPGGITYLGPSPTPGTWTERKGMMYPYSFQYPPSMNLGVFPNDPTDSVTAFIDGTDSSQNIFFRVENLTGKPVDYTKHWWKQYNWKGVASVTQLTNSNNLTGYRARYTNDKNETPYDHVFFEVPGKKDLIIWISGRLFTQADFDRLVDSVAWK